MKVIDLLAVFKYCTVQFFYGSHFLDKAIASPVYFCSYMLENFPEALLNAEIFQALPRGNFVFADIGIILEDDSDEMIEFMNSII